MRRIVVGVLALDNPVYSALTGDHASFALANGAARRYPGDMAPFCGLLEPTPEALAALRELTAPGERVAVLTTVPLDSGGGWELVSERRLDQMVLEGPPAGPAARAAPVLG